MNFKNATSSINASNLGSWELKLEILRNLSKLITAKLSSDDWDEATEDKIKGTKMKKRNSIPAVKRIKLEAKQVAVSARIAKVEAQLYKVAARADVETGKPAAAVGRTAPAPSSKGWEDNDEGGIPSRGSGPGLLHRLRCLEAKHTQVVARLASVSDAVGADTACGSSVVGKHRIAQREAHLKHRIAKLAWRIDFIKSRQKDAPSRFSIRDCRGKGLHGKGFHGKGFHGKGMGWGKGLHGKGFHGKGFHGKGFHGKGLHGKGFHGKGMGCGKGLHGKGFHGKGMGHGKGLYGKNFHGKGHVVGLQEFPAVGGWEAEADAVHCMPTAAFATEETLSPKSVPSAEPVETCIGSPVAGDEGVDKDLTAAMSKSLRLDEEGASFLGAPYGQDHEDGEDSKGNGGDSIDDLLDDDSLLGSDGEYDFA